MRALAGIVLVIAAVIATADETGLISKKSPYTPAETLNRLGDILKEKGITVFDRIDHGANAANADQPLPPIEVLLFGNPKLGTPLMAANPASGIDLPLKALAWRDADGQTWLTYNDPSYIARRHQIKGVEPVLEKMRAALDTFTNAAIDGQAEKK